MINKVAIKFAASTLVLGVTMVGCKPSADMYRPQTASAKPVKAEQGAAQSYELAQQAMREGDFAAALRHAEKAVELSQRDVGYRMLLGDLYLKNGRFLSAETSFYDVLELDPGNSRATFNLALSQVALSKNFAAVNHLNSLVGTAAPGDLGLAYALAGQQQRAVELLETAARAPDADGRVRQNLALAYALSGDWQKARIVAAQDVSPAEINQRMEKWAAFAQPASPYDQVASLLGVTPTEDSGQPVRLALAPQEPEPAAYADAQQELATPVAVPETPVELAAVEEPVLYETFEAPAPVAIPTPATEVTKESPAETIQFAHAAESLIKAQPAVIRTPAPVSDTPIRTFAPAVAKKSVVEKRQPKAKIGRYVVQLGAFGTQANVERAWAKAVQLYDFDEATPLSTTIEIDGKGILHRLSVAGFESRSEATQLCRSIKSRSGACFVRAVAGDRPVQWASRYSRKA